MKTKVGIWIDHRKANVVTISDKGEVMGLVISNVERQLRRSGDSPLKGPYEAELVPPDDKRKKAFTGHLNRYYDAVIACIGDAESIFIFGPGVAKGELQKRLGKSKVRGDITTLETAAKMTVNQIAAKVRAHFAEQKGKRRK